MWAPNVHQVKSDTFVPLKSGSNSWLVSAEMNKQANPTNFDAGAKGFSTTWTNDIEKDNKTDPQEFVFLGSNNNGQHKKWLRSANMTSKSRKKSDIEENISSQNLYKTELCRSFEETGNCRYGTKCQFAHGHGELRPVLRHPKYKTEICKTYHSKGTCPYGKRCRFIHAKNPSSIFGYNDSQNNQDQEESDNEEMENSGRVRVSGSVVKLAPPPLESIPTQKLHGRASPRESLVSPREALTKAMGEKELSPRSSLTPQLLQVCDRLSSLSHFSGPVIPSETQSEDDQRRLSFFQSIATE